jgi:hypothetical protein
MFIRLICAIRWSETKCFDFHHQLWDEIFAFWSHIAVEILSFYLNTRSEINSPSPLVISLRMNRIIIFGEMVVFSSARAEASDITLSGHHTKPQAVFKFSWSFDLTLICGLFGRKSVFDIKNESLMLKLLKSSMTFLFWLRKKKPITIWM